MFIQQTYLDKNFPPFFSNIYPYNAIEANAPPGNTAYVF
jgi:hypothetical protein